MRKKKEKNDFVFGGWGARLGAPAGGGPAQAGGPDGTAESAQNQKSGPGPDGT